MESIILSKQDLVRYLGSHEPCGMVSIEIHDYNFWIKVHIWVSKMNNLKIIWIIETKTIHGLNEFDVCNNVNGSTS